MAIDKKHWSEFADLIVEKLHDHIEFEGSCSNSPSEACCCHDDDEGHHHDHENDDEPSFPTEEVWERQMTAEEHVPVINTPRDLAPYIDHTLLDAKATRDQLKSMCEEALAHGFATVCVNSSNVKFVAHMLQDSAVKPIAVVGFPLGAASTDAKSFEAHCAVEDGALEIDMVINIAQLKAKNYGYVFHDMAMVVGAANPHKVKVILETSELTDEEKVAACILAKAAGAAFVKTSTGFSHSGATSDDVKLMKKTVGRGVEVKASGGIRSYEDAMAMIAAGATRIGASKSVAIISGEKSEKPGY